MRFPVHENSPHDGATVDRFLRKVDIVDDADSCWTWRGSTKKPPGLPYGFFVASDRLRTTHRVSWEMANGSSVPSGQVVRHRCHNASCVRPAHLLLGTQADNVADTVDSGRQARQPGESNGQAILTKQIVVEIIHAHGTFAEVAARYGVSRAHVKDIKSGRRWAHVARPAIVPGRRRAA